MTATPSGAAPVWLCNTTFICLMGDRRVLRSCLRMFRHVRRFSRALLKGERYLLLCGADCNALQHRVLQIVERCSARRRTFGVGGTAGWRITAAFQLTLVVSRKPPPSPLIISAMQRTREYLAMEKGQRTFFVGLC